MIPGILLAVSSVAGLGIGSVRMHKLLGCLLSALVLGCSGDDADASPTYGTCDRSEVALTCIESTGPAQDIENQRQGCLAAAGTWTSDACPAANLVGCCTYDYGLEFRECFYVGTTIAEPEGYCDSFFGTWTPGQ